MSELAPNLDATDKAFSPPVDEADKAGAPNEQETDNGNLPPADESTEETWTRALFSRKMHELGADRRSVEQEKQALAAERERLAYLAELDAQLAADEDKRTRFERAYSELQNGQAANGPAPDLTAIEKRIEQKVEARLARRDHDQAFHRATITVAKEYGLTPKEMEAVVQMAVDRGVLHYGVPAERVEDVLDLVAAKATRGRARAEGAADLSKQIREQGRVATPRTKSGEGPPVALPDSSKMNDEQRRAYMLDLVRKGNKAG